MRRRLMPWLAFAAVAVITLVVFVRLLEPRFSFFPFKGEDVTPAALGMAFEAVTVQTADGERLRAWRIPAASPKARVVYFHGNGGNLSNWMPILAGVARRGYSVFALDYRGYGLSTGSPSESGLYKDVDATVAAAWTDRDPRIPLVYWGRSLGTPMAAHAATVRKPDGLILESGFPDARSVIRSSPILLFLSFFGSYRFPTAALANRARVPSLVLHGDRDSIIPYPLGQQLFERIEGAKTFVTIAGADHNDAAPPDERAYWSAIDRFVTGLPRTP